ncbi:MAG TPA: tetratricopeptide repeat protein, partial [Longimicrobiaceae bacterium]|nr:tetratricopeptide repeat protein [Longimicrobiaceae bacterium]
RYAEAEQRAQAIRNEIGLRRMLLVVDDAWQREATLYLRCGGPNCCHLLTTRDDAIARAFAGAFGCERVLELEEDPAFELLRKLVPEACDADPEAARHLARSVGGLPLALELVGAYLAAPERSLFPDLTAQAFADLADPARRLELAQRRLGTLDGREVTLQEAIALSLDGLPEQAVRAFHVLGAFAPKPETFDREAALAITEADSGTLALLVSRNLVERDGERLAMHQTIREVACADMPPNARERHARRYLDRVKVAGDDWRKIEEVYGQVKWAFESVTDDDLSLRFANVLTRYQQLRGLWGDSLRWKKRGLEAAGRKQDRRTVGVLLNNIGSVHDSVGQKEKALHYYERALPIMQEVGDRAGEANTLNNIGLVYNRLGQREKALHYFERALSIRQEVSDRAGEATTLNNIGGVYDSLGQRKKALHYYERALPIMQEVGDRAGEAITRFNLALIYWAQGRLEQAVGELRRVVELDELVQHPDLEQDRAALAQIEQEWREQQEGESG